MTPRDAFPGYDDPVNINLEPDDAVRLLVDADTESGGEAEETEE